jgi:hypothetical protein
LRTLTLAAAGGALTSLGFGISKHLQAITRARTFSDYRGPAGGLRICGEDDLNRGGPGCAELYSSARGAQRWAIVGYGLAGAFAIGSVLLHATGRDLGNETATTAMGCAPMTAGQGLACTVGF